MNLARPLSIILTFLLLPALLPPSTAQPQDKKTPGGLSAFSKTRLEARAYSGGDLDSSFPWVKAVTIVSGTALYFRWRTSEQGVTSAEWQVTDSPGGFSGQSAVVASGHPAGIPAAGQNSEFAIDFKQFIPQSPPAPPKFYYVRVVPRKGRLNLAPSPAVKITYRKPGPQQVIQDFNIDRFEQNLKARLVGKATGFAYAIYEYDTLKKAGAGGHAVWPQVPHSPDRRTTMLSMSKTITAAAVMKAMEQMRARGQNITINSPIAPYLPSNWTRGPRVDELTFKHLLTHKGGLRGVDVDPDTNDVDTYVNLRQTIANGVINENFGKWVYQNANFCLFRIIIPYMVSDRAVLKTSESNTDFIARHTGITYVRYVQNHVLEPIGLGGINVVPTGPMPYTRYYKFNSPLISFTDPTDDTATLRTGAGYWHMSVKEFGKFISALRHHGKIVSSDSFKVMKDNELGMYGVPETHGSYWNHNGGTGKEGGPGAVSDWTIFPNGITAVIHINSLGGLSDPYLVIRNAFNESW